MNIHLYVGLNILAWLLYLGVVYTWTFTLAKMADYIQSQTKTTKGFYFWWTLYYSISLALVLLCAVGLIYFLVMV